MGWALTTVIPMRFERKSTIWSPHEIQEKIMRDTERKIRNIENGLVEFMPDRGNKIGEVRKSLSDRMEFYHVPGVSIALVNNYEVEWSKAYGVLKASRNTPVTCASIFQAASSTKLLTSIIVLHYIEQGKLELDRDVDEYLKSWKIPPNDFTQTEKVTLRRLLTHTAGLNRPDEGFSSEAGSTPSLLDWLKGEYPAQNQAAEVEYVPGTKWQYSNMGYLVLQAIIEDAIGKPFVKVAQEIILDPLGMDSSSLEYPLSEAWESKEAMPHDGDGNACDPEMMSGAVAHAGLMTTTQDFAAVAIELMRAYQGESEGILSRDMVRGMFHFVSDHAPDVAGFELRQGLGVLLRGEGDRFSFLHPGGNEPGSTCWIEGFPELGKGIVILANGARGDVLSLEIIPAMMNEYLE